MNKWFEGRKSKKKVHHLLLAIVVNTCEPPFAPCRPSLMCFSPCHRRSPLPFHRRHHLPLASKRRDKNGWQGRSLLWMPRVRRLTWQSRKKYLCPRE
ncbi:hypothetical protein E5676_scaffold506G00630 [Cucumis melo var. makuwa]|uniref:Uncharacterized protein n=1 Tax=Cucumis melo var. makuwa TaxID=1194695 RepID=A0A5D3BAZ4_CUCMM|nr:hypothetical protein E6C27_scaffold270G002700 [Cucumis melo var. makuwa]TYJ97010.1 hypothetical protein E5676_scaffold506G00630 [Cucumis melo var. makuwa]